MSIIDTRYKFIELDLILEKTNGNIIFSKSDVETSDFFVKITKNREEINLLNYKITLWICKPNGVTKSKILTEYDAITNTIYCNLEEGLKNVTGTYIAQIAIEDENTKEIKLTRSKFHYVVISDIISEIDDSVIEKNETILDDILKRLTALETSGTGSGASIDDTTTALNKTWSSDKINSQFEGIANLSLTKHTDGKVYIKKQDGTFLGDGIEIGGSDVDLSKISMSMSGQTLKLMNDGTQIATVEIPTATDEQVTNAINNAISKGLINNTGWTISQINLLDSIFSCIPWTTSTAGAIADSLIASLKSSASSSGGSSGNNDNITQTGSTLIITSLANEPSFLNNVLTIA